MAKQEDPSTLSRAVSDLALLAAPAVAQDVDGGARAAGLLETHPAVGGAVSELTEEDAHVAEQVEG